MIVVSQVKCLSIAFVFYSYICLAYGGTFVLTPVLLLKSLKNILKVDLGNACLNTLKLPIDGSKFSRFSEDWLNFDPSTVVPAQQQKSNKQLLLNGNVGNFC